MENKIFGTDGMRGVYSKFPIVNSALTILCDALKQRLNVKNVLIGIDTRPSGKKIFSILCKKFHDIGVNVYYAHYVTTPMISHFLYNHEKIDDMANDFDLNVQFDCGIMITASHNTHEYNGLKIFYCNGKKVNYEDEQWIEKFINKSTTKQGAEQGVVNETDLNDLNNLKYKNIHKKVLGRYMQFIQNVASLFLDSKLRDELHGDLYEFFSQNKIFLDCANGVTSLFAKKVFNNLLSKYGIQNSIQNTEQNTTQNKSQHKYEDLSQKKDLKISPLIVENTDVKNTEMLNKNASVLSEDLFRSKMKRVGANIGFAFDGDGDRVIGMMSNESKLNRRYNKENQCEKNQYEELIEHKLSTIDGDDICAIFVQNSILCGTDVNEIANRVMKKNALKRDLMNEVSSAVITLDSNSGLVDFLNANNIEYRICNVGDKNVQRSMDLFNACIGTEASGHVLTKLNPFCGDGILISVILLCILSLSVVNESKKLSQLGQSDELPQLGQLSDLSYGSGLVVIHKNPRLSLKLSFDDFERFVFANAMEIEQVADEIWNRCVESTDESIDSLNCNNIDARGNMKNNINFENRCYSNNLTDNPSFRDVYLYTIAHSVHESDLDHAADFTLNSDVDCNVIPFMNYKFHSRDEVLFVAKCEVLKRKMLSSLSGNCRDVKKVLMRPSGTEPVVRLTVECENEFLVEMIKKWINKRFEKKL